MLLLVIGVITSLLFNDTTLYGGFQWAISELPLASQFIFKLKAPGRAKAYRKRPVV